MYLLPVPRYISGASSGQFHGGGRGEKKFILDYRFAKLKLNFHILIL